MFHGSNIITQIILRKSYFFAFRRLSHKIALGCVPGANLDGFWPQKSTKICSWTALEASWSRLGGIVLGRVGGFLRRLGASWALLELPEAAKSSKSIFSVGFKEPERGWCRRSGTTGEWPVTPCSPPQKGFFKDKTINHQP